MKEKFLKLGVLATALVLAFVFAACAQPTEDTVGPGTPAIIRLYLDRAEHKTLTKTDKIVLRAGEELNTALGANEADRLKALYVDAGGPTYIANPTAATGPNSTYLESSIPEISYFSSGELTLVEVTKTGALATGTPIAVSTDAQYYVDIELVNLTDNVLEKGSTLSDGLSLYLELTVDAAATGGMTAGVYYYTPEKTVLNDWNSGTNGYLDTNSNIERVDISAGINEIYLSQFSRGNTP